jgi:hypothetical protein
MTDAHELTRGQRRHVAKIEEQRPAAESEVDDTARDPRRDH